MMDNLFAEIIDAVDSFSDLMILSVAFCRVLLGVLTLEIACRYFNWWYITRKESDTDILSQLMWGVAWSATGFFGFTLYALMVARVPRGPLALTVYFICDAVITYALFQHLIPAWRMNATWSVRVNRCISLRLWFSIITALFLVVAKLQ